MKLSRWCNQVRRSFGVAFPSFYWFAISLVFPAALTPILLLSGFQTLPDPRDPLYYLLSAQAETLGTLIVLAFTFSLVAAQIASRYSQILLHQLLGAWALWYAIPFGVGILLPLFLLRGDFYLWSAQSSLLVASYCIFSLVPFANTVRRLLSMSETMSAMKEEVVTSATEAEAKDLIRKLGNVAIGALNLRDYETFELGIQELTSCVDANPESTRFRLLVSREMRRLIIRTTGEQFASETLCDAMFELGVRQPSVSPSVEDHEVLDEVAEAFRSVTGPCLRHYGQKIALIEEYANVAIDRRARSVVSKLQVMLHVIGERAISGNALDEEPVREALSALGNIGQRVLNEGRLLSNPANLMRSGIMAIEHLGTKGLNSNKKQIGEWAKIQLQRTIGNPSDIAREVEGNARASIAVLES